MQVEWGGKLRVNHIDNVCPLRLIGKPMKPIKKETASLKLIGEIMVPKTIDSILTLLHQTESLVDQFASHHWVRTTSGVERVLLFNFMVFERSVIYHAFDLCQSACLLEYSGTVWGSRCSAIVGDLGIFF